MARKRFSTEQIVAKSREAERLQGQGMTVAQVCRRIGISDQTFFRWRMRYGALKVKEYKLVKPQSEHVTLTPTHHDQPTKNRCRPRARWTNQGGFILITRLPLSDNRP